MYVSFLHVINFWSIVQLVVIVRRYPRFSCKKVCCHTYMDHFCDLSIGDQQLYERAD